MPNHELLTVTQAAQVSGLSASTLKRRIAAQLLPARYSDTGTWLIEQPDLMTFLAVHESSRAPLVSVQRTGATGQGSSRYPAEPSILDHLNQSLERERQLNADLQRTGADLRAQNKELQGEILKLNAEMLALLKGEGKGLLSRWLKK
jgi:hypothetical protein